MSDDIAYWSIVSGVVILLAVFFEFVFRFARKLTREMRIDPPPPARPQPWLDTEPLITFTEQFR